MPTRPPHTRFHVPLYVALFALTGCPQPETPQPQDMKGDMTMPSSSQDMDSGTEEMPADMVEDASMQPAEMGETDRDASTDQDADIAGDDMPSDMAPPAKSPICALEVASLRPSGRDIPVSPGADAIGEALADAQPGDRLLLAAGTYAKESLKDVRFSEHVFLQAAPGEEVTIEGLSCLRCSHLVFRDIAFTGDTVNLDAADHIVFDHVSMTAPDNTSVLRIYGQRNGACSHIDVFDSEITGGQRTIFILGRFAPSEEWNTNLRFVRNRIECGTNNCFQISGGRDVLIADNALTSKKSVAVLTAGATRVEVRRNRMLGREDAGAAMNIATPGRQWDNFGGVGNMISSDIQIVNNLIQGWSGAGITLNAARDIDIAHNTVIGGTGLRTSHRTPMEYMSDEVILEGNQDYRVWNNIFERVSIASEDPAPSFSAKNVIAQGNLDGWQQTITEDPQLSGSPEWAPLAGSPVVDAGASGQPAQPSIDRFGQPRDTLPDVGAVELGSTQALCQ